MSTTVLVHPTSLALTTLPRVGSSSSTPLAFPSRYPANSTPRSTLSNAGHVFLWCDALPLVWEYDSRGRRVGEIKISSSSREHILGVGCLSDGGVSVVTERQAGIWRRVDGKWAKDVSLEAPGNVSCVDGGDVVVIAGDEVVLYDSTGSRLDVDVGLEAPLGCVCATRSGLLVPTPDGVTLVSLSSEASTSFPLPGPVTVLSASRSSERAAAVIDTSIAFLSLSSPSETRLIEVGHEISGLAWLDSANVAAYTTSGRLILVTMEGDISEVPLDSPVLGVHVLPPKRRSVSGPKPLGESNTLNVLGRGAGTWGPGDKEKGTGEKGAGAGEKQRQVSAPAATPSIPAIDRLKGKHTPKERPTPQSVRTAGTVRIQPLDPQRTRVAVLDSASVASSPRSVHSRRDSWPSPPSPPGSAHSSPPSTRREGFDSEDGPGWAAFEEMRREIANLQLDMLRVGRGIKNEIRAAVGPLVEEIRSNREIIARQQAEIERLRRGY